MTRPLLLLSALSLTLAACESEFTGPECSPVSLSQSSLQGDTVTLNTGLRYVELQAGEGAAVAYCDLVRVGYEGRFVDGEVFDPGDRPFDLYLGYGQSIVGFEQGLVGMQKGGRRQLIIPPLLGYGIDGLRNQQGQVIIPGNSTLIFDVELIDHLPAGQ